MSSFHREYEFVFEAVDGSSVQLDQQFDKIGLAIDFDITKSRSKSANSASLTIINPSKDTISTFQKEGICRFKAGYKGDIASILVGSKESISFEDDFGDKRVELSIVEGLTKYENLQFSKQYGIGTTNLQIITDLVSHIVGNNPSVDGSNLFVISDLKIYSNPQVLFGDALEILDRFLTPIGYQYFINKGILTIIGQDGFIKELEVFLNSDNGMIGYPKPISDTDGNKNSKPGVEVRSILSYNFDVGRRVRLQSKEYNNTAYIIDTVRFAGSTYDGEYICDLKMYEATV